MMRKRACGIRRRSTSSGFLHAPLREVSHLRRLLPSEEQPHEWLDPSGRVCLVDYPIPGVWSGKKLAAQAQWPPSRAEQVQAIEEGLLRDYANPALTEPPASSSKFDGLMSRCSKRWP